MRLMREIKDRQIVAFVFTGDGQTEANNLSPLCEKFNGTTKTLWFPKTPLPEIRSRASGVHALLPLRLLVTRYELDRVLFILDREHFSVSSRRRAQEINEVLRFLRNKLNIVIENITELVQSCAFVINCWMGDNHFELCLAIRGTSSNADEERARLVQIKLSSKVEPHDREINHFLRESGIDEKDLIRGCSLNHLNKAFPSLCSALRWLEAQS